MQKALKTANSEKFVFSCQTSKWCLSLQIRLLSAENRLQTFAVPNSVFCAEKPANSSPPSSSPLVTASSPLAFWSQKSAKAARSPQGFPRSDRQGPARSPAARRGGPSARRGGPSARRASRYVRLCFLAQKALKTVEFQPAELVTVRHRFVTASSPLGPKSAQKAWRLRSEQGRAAELADHGPLQQGRPVGLRRAPQRAPRTAWT